MRRPWVRRFIEIVERHHLMAKLDQRIDKMRSDKPSPARYQDI